MNTTDRTHELVAAWRAADNRYVRMNGRWWLVQTVMWLLALPAVVLLALGWSVPVPALLTFAALAVGGDRVLRLIRADQVRDAAWKTLVEYTGLGAVELARLVDEVEDSGGAL